jgi:AbrB family looped-hinge helix DNA binding protein
MANFYEHADAPDMRFPTTAVMTASSRRRAKFRAADPGTNAGFMLGITIEDFGITMANMTKMTTKGQVTIPKRLRNHLGLKPGSNIDFELAEDGRVFLKTHPEVPESRFARLRGSAKPGMTTDELMRLTRGEDTG